ncbi:MAG TPA: dihydrodipicolinate synthase family protein [Thermoguttaceae bacterium]|nr:dihydrodipicolinate synthase family protein [Thermoguttaceae bacterium]
MDDRLQGLIAATYTPMDDRGRLSLKPVQPMVDRLIDEGITGLYVCGSTGEGMSLSGTERREVVEAFAEAAAGRVPVIAQVGHNSVTEAAELAAHAEQAGVDVVSATAPSYFKVTSVEQLVDCMAEIAAGAPKLPFYYYHIPALTGAALDMPTFLQQAGDRIANLAGLKYTSPTVHEYQACVELEDHRYDILWGCDEMLLSGWVAGARGAVGSTYNIAAPLYGRIIEAFTSGDLDQARRLQGLSVAMVRTIAKWPFHSAMKEILRMIGSECGRCRLPQPRLADDQIDDLRESLQQIGFLDWARQ